MLAWLERKKTMAQLALDKYRIITYHTIYYSL